MYLQNGVHKKSNSDFSDKGISDFKLLFIHVSIYEATPVM